jgi:hypothetical protein
VRRATKERAIDYPVAVDNDYEVWSAFANRYWPALYFVDADGIIRDQHFGVGRYEQSELVAELLSHEAKARVLGGNEQPRCRVPYRVAEDEEASSPFGGSSKKPLVVGAAADHAMSTTTSPGSTLPGSIAMSWMRRSTRL